jgi:cell division protein FtsL
VLFFIEMLGYTWARVQSVNIGYEITAANREYEQLITTRNNLKIEQARLKSPERIARIANERLGLFSPEPSQTMELP